jgi:hypothetical protein
MRSCVRATCPDLASAAEEDRFAYAYTLVPWACDTAEYVTARAGRHEIPAVRQSSHRPAALT